MLLAMTLCSSASSSVRNSRVDTGSFAALRCRKKSISISRPARAPEQEAQMLFHRRPFAFDDAEHDRVAIAPVGSYLMIAQHAVLLRAEAHNRFARGVIEPVRAKLDGDALERFERMREQQQFALGIDRRAL